MDLASFHCNFGSRVGMGSVGCSAPPCSPPLILSQKSCNGAC